MVAHWRVAWVHGATMWRSTVMGHRPPVVWLGPAGVHAWRRGPRVGPRVGALALGSCGRSSCSSGSSLLLHLLPGLHLCVAELLHVEGLTLGKKLLTLELQLEKRRTEQGVRDQSIKQRWSGAKVGPSS